MLLRLFTCVQIVVLIKCWLVVTCSAAYEGSSCEWGDSQPGICRKLRSCPKAIEAVLKRNTHSYPRCGFEQFDEIVCCPDDSVNIKTTTTTMRTTREGDVGRPVVGPKSSLRKVEQVCEEYSKDVPTLLVPHIIGGDTADAGEFPHMTALGYLTDGVLEFKCGGTLISYDFVLTAGHCIHNVQGVMPSTVRIGTITITDDSDKEETDFEVADIITHPQYKRPAKYHDIALIKLARQARVSVYIRPACLYASSENPSESMIVTGWGATQIGRRDKSDTLLKANLTAVDMSECNVTYKILQQRKLPSGIIEDQICAVDRGGKMDTCLGDSGGPLQIPTDKDGVYQIVGITSFGLGCGSTRPGVYTRVSKYLNWIENIVWPA